MPRDRRHITHLFRLHALQLIEAAGPGSWEEFSVTESTPDGKGLVVITVAPCPEAGKSAEKEHEQPVVKTGRPAESARHILEYLRDHGDAFHGELMDAMGEMGFSRSAVHRNLKVLVSMGLVLHPDHDGRYSLPEGRKNA